MSETNTYYEERSNTVLKSITDNKNPYPHKFVITKSFSEYIAEYNNIDAGSRLTEKRESLAGRVETIRGAGKLYFLTVISNFNNVQFMLAIENFGKDVKVFKDTIASISRGDIIGASGFVAKSHKGELSLMVDSIQVLTPCLHELPKKCFGVKDKSLVVSKRYLNFMANSEAYKPFFIRNKVIKFLRKYLDDRDFLEVQTPILTTKVGGATAKPFETFHNDYKIPMFMRIAPELYLKQLVVGGFDRVYELGPQFRNESCTYRHNPEFWSLEFYQSYADYNDLIKTAEDLLTKMVLEIKGTLKFSYTPHNSTIPVEIDFTPPFKKYDMMEEINNGIAQRIIQNKRNKLIDDIKASFVVASINEKGIGVNNENKSLLDAIDEVNSMVITSDLDFPNDLSSIDALNFYDKACADLNIECTSPRTIARLLDKLCGEFIEVKCTNPTFIMHHPVVMSPLAKWHRDNPQLTERFELFINGMEFANAYTELNNPFMQKNLFEKQMLEKAKGDDEVPDIDEGFIEALEYGLAPLAGFGLGCERLTMLLSDRPDIDDVIYFPTSRGDFQTQHIDDKK